VHDGVILDNVEPANPHGSRSSTATRGNQCARTCQIRNASPGAPWGRKHLLSRIAYYGESPQTTKTGTKRVVYQCKNYGCTIDARDRNARIERISETLWPLEDKLLGSIWAVDDEFYSPREATRDALAYLNSQYIDGDSSTDLTKKAFRMALAEDEELDEGLMKLLLGMTSIAKLLTKMPEQETATTPEQTMQQLGTFIAVMPESDTRTTSARACSRRSHSPLRNRDVSLTVRV
jgi:hypothetical protein